MSLVTYTRYVAITGDTTSASATVLERLTDAQDLLEEELGRVDLLEDDGQDKVERLLIYNDANLGYVVYPAAVPVTDAGDLIQHGSVLAGAAPDSSPEFSVVSGERYATVTYRGGYTPATVPPAIERNIAWAAHQLLTPALTAAVPAGATSVRLGDAAVTFDRPQSNADSGIRWTNQVRRYRRRRV